MLEFNASTHTYRMGGRPVPNVTRVLDLLGAYANIPDDVLDWKSQIGGAVHEATALLDADDLDEDSLDESIVGYVDAWKKFKRDTRATMLVIERRVYHPLHDYAGTLDRVMQIGKKKVLGEIKCTAQSHPLHRLQTAAYLKAYQAGGEQPAAPAAGRLCIYLRADGTYKLEQHTDLHAEATTFCGLLQLYHWITLYANKKGAL